MRMLLTVTIPHEPFNTLVRQKKAGAILQRILGELKPEAAYFTEENGTRGAVLVIDVAEPSRVPFFAEPFFLSFNADCRFRLVMSPDELGKAGLDKLGEKWA
ncbi:MAG: panthothenate synthetase [Acidobacteria bacterium]|nr:MAG: panthothenate synthetase [Acidobacteriota bacterium]